MNEPQATSDWLPCETDTDPSSEETQELWRRIAQMWLAGATRKEIRGAEGLSKPRLEAIIKQMRAHGYELADVYRRRPDEGWIPQVPRRTDPHRRRHPWRPHVG